MEITSIAVHPATPSSRKRRGWGPASVPPKLSEVSVSTWKPVDIPGEVHPGCQGDEGVLHLLGFVVGFHAEPPRAVGSRRHVRKPHCPIRRSRSGPSPSGAPSCIGSIVSNQSRRPLCTIGERWERGGTDRSLYCSVRRWPTRGAACPYSPASRVARGRSPTTASGTPPRRRVGSGPGGAAGLPPTSAFPPAGAAALWS